MQENINAAANATTSDSPNKSTQVPTIEEQVWQAVDQRTQMKRPMNPSTLMVLNDGETYSTLQDCTIVVVDLIAVAQDGVDLDMEVKAAVRQGYFSKYVKLLTRFS